MRISIVTPSFSQGRFIERTLLSVASQGVEELEHLVMDGGSRDETVAILRRFQPPVRWVSEPDKGQTDALNKGVMSSTGEIIGWLNSDDIYYSGALERVLKVFDANPDIDIVYGRADHIDLDDHAFEEYPTEPYDPVRLQDTCFICQPALFLRRRVVEQYGLPDDTLHYCMDYEYWLRLGMRGARFLYLDEKLAGSRLYGENKTLGARVAVHVEINDVMRRTFGRVPDRWIFNYAHAMVEPLVDRASSPRRFVVCLLMHSLRAALRWNRSLTPGMWRVMAQWGHGLLPGRAGVSA
jgi:glycosyltransferase involved in cell wall biosynthesis